MKYSKLILEFRKAYYKLKYFESDMTVYTLREWVKEWCKENGVPLAIYNDFYSLTLAYVEKEHQEECLAKRLKR